MWHAFAYFSRKFSVIEPPTHLSCDPSLQPYETHGQSLSKRAENRPSIYLSHKLENVLKQSNVEPSGIYNHKATRKNNQHSYKAIFFCSKQ